MFVSQQRRVLFMWALAACAWSAAPAQAAIIGATGQVQIISPPPSVALGATESSLFIRTFQERQGLILPAGIPVSITTPGLYDDPGDLTPGIIPAGTFVDSYFVFTDPVGSVLSTYVGSITFDTDILGIVVTTAGLDASDGFLGAPGTIYPTGTLPEREFELGAPGGSDSLTITPDRRTVIISVGTAAFQDTLRVITVGTVGTVGIVPEPSSFALLGLGLLGLLLWLRRRADAPLAGVVGQ